MTQYVTLGIIDDQIPQVLPLWYAKLCGAMDKVPDCRPKGPWFKPSWKLLF